MGLSHCKMVLLPGGQKPERQTEGAIGFDAYLRAIVSPIEMDLTNPPLRKTLFDFRRMPEDPKIAGQVQLQPYNNGAEMVYRMQPGEQVLVGIGFVTEFDFPYFYSVAPRSGLASRSNITVTNAPGTVDPDYRGEAGVAVLNRGPGCFDLRQGMRIAQIIFQKAEIPEIEIVGALDALKVTGRAAGGFGSTGLVDR